MAAGLVSWEGGWSLPTLHGHPTLVLSTVHVLRTLGRAVSSSSTQDDLRPPGPEFTASLRGRGRGLAVQRQTHGRPPRGRALSLPAPLGPGARLSLLQLEPLGRRPPLRALGLPCGHSLQARRLAGSEHAHLRPALLAMGGPRLAGTCTGMRLYLSHLCPWAPGALTTFRGRPEMGHMKSGPNMSPGHQRRSIRTHPGCGRARPLLCLSGFPSA